MISSTSSSSAEIEISALTARLKLLEEENRWLKAQLFGRSTEKTPREYLHPGQAWLFNEAEALAAAAETLPVSVTIRAHQRLKHGRKRLDASLPRVDVIHDIADAEKRCATDGTTLERIGEEVSEQLDYQPAKIRVIRNIRPKYACPCCRQGIKIAPVPSMLFPKSIATPALLAQITTAKFVDHVPLYRQETQFGRLRVFLGRATMAGWMIRLGATHVVPIINLLTDLLLEAPLIHCDETRLQVLNSDKSTAADHWMWVRAAGSPGRRIILFDYDPSRSGTVPRRLLEGYRGILLTVLRTGQPFGIDGAVQGEHRDTRTRSCEPTLAVGSPCPGTWHVDFRHSARFRKKCAGSLRRAQPHCSFGDRGRATIAFLRAHGLDALVDAYGVHSYPSGGKPGNPTVVAQRTARLKNVDLAVCRAKDSTEGKPCWITEWGFPNADLSCPAKEAERTQLIEEFRRDFAAAAAEHRLVGIDYFSWNSDPWAKQPDPDSEYRCGGLTASGRAAIAPSKQ